MNKVITAGEVRTRLSLMDDEGVNAAISSAIGAALVHTESLLQTNLQAGTAEDIFFIDPLVDSAVRGTYLLRLSNGFVKQAGMTLRSAATLSDMQAASDAVAAFVVMEERGFISVDESLSGSFLKVNYSFGFGDSDDAPAWLKDVVLSYTAKVLSSQQIADGKPELSNIFSFLDRHGSAVLDRHLRSHSDSILPIG